MALTAVRLARMVCWLCVLAIGLTAIAQVAVPVGAGSYASFVPAFDQQSDEYYAPGAQQMIDLCPSLHLDPSLAGRPVPSNQWWTDTAMGVRGWSYNATNTPPSVVTQDPFGGQLWSFPAMVAPNSSGFDLYFPNSWVTGTPPVGGFNAGPALPITGAVPLAVGSNDVLIADFDETNYPAGWVATGNAFGTSPIVGGSWPGQSPPVTGLLGDACVNTYRGGDSFEGTLTSPAFLITKNFIQLLVGGGNDLTNDAVWLVISNQVVGRAAGNDSGVLNWNTWNVSAYSNQTAQIEIVDTTGGGWGHVMCSWIVATDDGSDPSTRYKSTYTATQSVVTGWSDWGFQFGLPDAAGRRMDVTLARGVPFVWTTCSGLNPAINLGTTTVYDTNNQPISLAGSNSFTATAFSFDDQGRSFGVFAPDSTTFLVSGTTLTAQLSGTNNYLVYGLLPAHTNLNEFGQYAYAEVTNTRMDWVYDRTNGQVDSTWTLTTTPLENGQTNTLQGWLPHHYRTTQNNLAFKPYTYLTPRGVMKVAAGHQFQVDYAFHGLAPVLPAPRTNGLPNDYVQSWMQTYLQNFANAGHPTGDETYGAGKDFGVTAQYLTFAQQMGLTNAATQLKAALEARLQDWYTYTPGEPYHFFALYTNWPALIGFAASYGSQGFNDNHFHYGYFMVGTALVGLSDPAWLNQYGPMAKLVAKEYANWDRSDTNFPFFRTFDIWEGHSWAGGTSSGGGENQESSSEAMNSWVGLFLMGNALGDDVMTAAGAMGYAMESAAVNEYWQDIYQTNFPPTYGKSMNGILGAGSLAFATYFDGDPAWVYAIQMVPQNHWNNYLVRNSAYAFLQYSNLWNDRLNWEPPWSNSMAYITGAWVNYNGFIWSANTNLAAGQPPPGIANSSWSQQANISTSTAQDLGAYPGNYVLSWEAMFNPNDVAAQFAASYATNGALTGDGTYSGITYYLAHALRGLGVQDANFYTSIPASQVYYNAQTGARTVLIYNPTATNLTATVFSNGTPVNTLSAAPGLLTVHAGAVPGTFEPTLVRNTQLGWPTTAGDNYQVQWTTPPAGVGSGWNDLTGLLAGDGTTNTLFDPLGADGARAYRVLEYTTYVTTNVANGGFELGTNSAAANWTSYGMEPPCRVNTNSHSGDWCMLLADTNQATGGIQFQQDEAAQGAAAIVPGLAYTFSFWAQQILSGVGFVQQYSLSWLDSSDSVISSASANFSGGGGYWSRIIVPGLVAPTNAVGVRINFNCTTGAANDWAGEVLIDDVMLGSAAPGATNVVAVTVQPGWQVSWPTANYVTYGLKRTAMLQATNGWADFGTSFAGTGVPVSVFDPVGTNQFKFYRVYAQP
ncbi:MAG: glycosyl hydrolase [Verrucomicrobiota bacterium]